MKLVDKENLVGRGGQRWIGFIRARSLVGGGGQGRRGMAPVRWAIAGTTTSPHSHEEMEMKLTGWAGAAGGGILKHKIIKGETSLRPPILMP